MKVILAAFVSPRLQGRRDILYFGACHWNGRGLSPMCNQSSKMATLAVSGYTWLIWIRTRIVFHAFCHVTLRLNSASWPCNRAFEKDDLSTFSTPHFCPFLSLFLLLPMRHIYMTLVLPISLYPILLNLSLSLSAPLCLPCHVETT